MSAPPSVADAALRYAREFGWSVIPTHPTTKKPVVAWARYQQEMADESTIRRWFTTYQAGGVAVITGAVSGLWVVDIDSAAGRERLRALDLPATPCVTSGKGAHLYFARPGDVRNTAGHIDGLDTRGDGGYVVAPPSIHPSGRPYTWHLAPWDVAPAVAPAALVALFATPAGSGHGAQPAGGAGAAYARMITEGAPAGRRHGDMVRLVGHYLARGLTDGEISVLLRPWVDRCAPPFPYAELDETIRTLRAAEERNHGQRHAPHEARPLAAAPRATATDTARYSASKPLEDIIDAYLARTGHGLRFEVEQRFLHGRCPFHQGHTDELWVAFGRGVWGCRVCRVKGDVELFLEMTDRPARGAARAS